VSGLENHASERSTYFYAYHYVDAVPRLWPSPASVVCQHPPRIYVFTRIFGRCKPTYICQSDPTNSQAILQLHQPLFSLQCDDM